MHQHHQIIIVGGGPAGSSAAFTLSNRGFDVCIIDKANFPRDKLCGGLLTLRSKKIFQKVFNRDWRELYEVESNGVKLFHRNSKLSAVEDYSNLYFTCRIEFDEKLLRIAESAGSKLNLGSGVKSICLKSKTCILASGEVLTYDYLIGADGVNSVIAKELFGKAFDPDKIALALEVEISDSDLVSSIKYPEIYFGVVKWGYAWVFPKKDSITVGLGGVRSKNPDLKKHLSSFLDSRFEGVKHSKIKGHHIPFGDYNKTPGKENVLLVGDAAGLVEPITGEGIAFAMQSGLYASEAIYEHITSNAKAPLIDLYIARYRSISNILDKAAMLRYLIFPKVSEYLFSKILPRSRSLTKRHLDLMADELDYNEYIKLILRKFITGAGKLLKRN